MGRGDVVATQTIFARLRETLPHTDTPREVRGIHGGRETNGGVPHTESAFSPPPVASGKNGAVSPARGGGAHHTAEREPHPVNTNLENSFFIQGGGAGSPGSLLSVGSVKVRERDDTARSRP